ncbi:uncharacterized protein LOC110451699 [Mizuhopecten yessoensis]|uniref:uncharacterized protein LOC110451699 n=1 Tax=Mizuhopecten yessoensis TaxID=6573 RepID=UPI000B45DDA5|nr:uncharacterized protein LOC110451699 [Mizuhopecten yessoensis]
MSMKDSKENFEVELKWILDHLKEPEDGKKMIVYVRSINLCYRIYLWLTTELMDVNEELVKRIQMFHANTDSETKEKIMLNFVTNCIMDSGIQLLISTVAFGLGVHITDIDIVIHWGLPSTALDYWQEIGRCARDGRTGHAICYVFKSVAKCEDNAFIETAKVDRCIRVCVLSQFLLEGMDRTALDK